jgi:hypothetical protein
MLIKSACITQKIVTSSANGRDQDNDHDMVPKMPYLICMARDPPYLVWPGLEFCMAVVCKWPSRVE